MPDINNVSKPFFKTYSLADTNEKDLSFSVVNTDSGNYILGVTDDGYLYLLKTDLSGNLLWKKKVVPEKGYSLEYGDLQKIGNDFIILIGRDSVVDDIYNSTINLIKVNADGDVVWNKTYNMDNYETDQSLAVTSDNGFLIVGNVDAGPTKNIILLKVDSTGKKVWKKTIPYTGSLTINKIKKIDNGFVLVGFIFNSNRNVYLAKINSNGTQDWNKVYSNLKLSNGLDVVQTTDGFAVVGNAGDDILLLKTDNTGNMVWYKTYSPEKYNYGAAITKAKDNGYLLGSSITNDMVDNSARNNNLYFIKVDSQGNKIWDKSINGSSTSFISQILTTDNGFLAVGYMYLNDISDFSKIILLNFKDDVN